MLFVFLQTIGLMAQESRFKEGETLNIWASSGLNMRDKPDAKEAKVSTIPYGAKVFVQPNIGLKIPFEVEEFKGFMVKGYWLLVKYGNTEGFVFDGFLSRLPAPIKNDSTTLEDYFDNQIGKVGKIYNVMVTVRDTQTDDFVTRPIRANEDINSIDCHSHKQKYKQGIISGHSTGEGGGGFSVEIPNITLYEGYFLAKIYSYDEKEHNISFEKKEKKVNMFLKESGAGCECNIKQVGNKIIIDGYCGC